LIKFSERNCGEIINESSGQIAYKLNKEYDSYERCAWTIVLPGASRYRFILKESNFETNSAGILVTGIGRNGTEVAIQTSVM